MHFLTITPAFLLCLFGMAQPKGTIPEKGVELIVLGTVQDAGSPQVGCANACCAALFDAPDPSRKVTSLGLIDKASGKRFLIEATPDIGAQMHELNRKASISPTAPPDGILLTHAHIGHYTGLMYLGKESMNTRAVPVYAMPRMGQFLSANGPWSQLINDSNIVLNKLSHAQSIALTPNLIVTPLLVPHRDEFSETVGFIISGPTKQALFIPDIDKWERWEKDIKAVIATVNYAFLDGTFFDNGELNNRDMSQIPHPFMVESMAQMDGLDTAQKQKIHFIHFNHTNPVLDPKSRQAEAVLKSGFGIARFSEVYDL